MQYLYWGTKDKDVIISMNENAIPKVLCRFKQTGFTAVYVLISHLLILFIFLLVILLNVFHCIFMLHIREKYSRKSRVFIIRRIYLKLKKYIISNLRHGMWLNILYVSLYWLEEISFETYICEYKMNHNLVESQEYIIWNNRWRGF